VYDIKGLTALAGGITVTAVAGLLMMSRFSYYSFKQVNLSGRVRFAQLLAIPLTLMVISIDPPIVLFLLALSYASSGPLLWLWRRFRRMQRQA
jgi:CDP-diacylglycerol--serine O-phosphatidyltransferase